MPTLARLTIYPLKAFDGQALDQAALLPSGAIEHDRRWALVDAEGNFVNGKRTPLVHAIRTRMDLEQARLTVQHRGETAEFSLHEDRPALEAWFSRRLERPLRLVENEGAGFPDDTDAPGPTVVSTATLECVAGWFDLSLDEVRRRFRANLEIGGVEPFWEDRLVSEHGHGVPFRVGDVQLEGTNPCQRCVVPSRSADSGEAIAGFSKQFAERREQALPPWATRSRFDHFYRLAVNTRPKCAGRMTVGDQVTLLAPG